MNADLKHAFAEAERALREAKTLLAWRELELSERRDDCEFWLAGQSKTPQQLKAQIGRFFALFFSIHEYIGTRPPATRKAALRQLQGLWKRFRAIELRIVQSGVIPAGA